MTRSWEDSDFDVTNPDLGLLMSDCPAELSIQSHSLMLNVRRSVKLPRSREGTGSTWTTQVPREVAVLRRAKSFQQPAVSTSIGPSLTRIRSFFDFSREDTLALDSEVSSIGNFCAGGVEEDDNQKAEEKEEVEAPTSSDVKPNLSETVIIENYCDAVNNDVEKAVGDKPVTGAAKVDVTVTIKKIESALEEALNVGSLKIDVRERIKRIQTAFEGFMPWDSGTGKSKGDLSDVKAVDTAELEKSRNAGVVKLTTSHSEDIKGGLHDSSIGDEACNLGFECTDNDSSFKLNQEQNIKEGRLDKLNKVDEVPVDTPGDPAAVNSAPDGAIDDRVVEDMEDGGLCDLNRVEEVASGTELENPTLTESDAFCKEERVSLEMEETGLGALDEVDEVQAVVLNFEAINPIVAVGDEPKHVRVNNDTVVEGLQEATGDSSCKVEASKSVGIQCDFIEQLKQGTVETPQHSDRFDMNEGSVYANIVNDASGELLNEKGFQDSAEVDKVQANLCWDSATGKSENLQSDDIVHQNTPGSAVVDLLLRNETETFEFREEEIIFMDMSGKGLKDLNGVDDARPNALWDSDTQIAVSSELKQERVVEEMNDNGLRKPNVKVDEVRPEAGGKSVHSENDTTDISGLPSPLFQLLDYRNGNAFTFLNVQDHFPDVGDCLLHDEEKVCHIQPGYLSQETNLKSLLAPGESWCSPDELISQSSGGKISDPGRPKVIVNLRRLRIRKSLRPNALKASPSERVVNTPGLHSSDLSRTVKNLCQDDLLLHKKKPDKGDFSLESNSPIYSVVDQAPLNVGQDSSHDATGPKKSRFVDEPSLEKCGIYGGSQLHVNKIPATPASVKRLVVESHKNLSEKYRPTRFGDLAGQTTVVKSLTTCISKQKIAPVYLFLGPRGIGKMSTARIFAAGLNCLSLEPKSRPCGSCRECRAVTLEMSPNVQILDAATVRDSSSMKTVVKLSVSQVGHKVIIIKECDSFSTEIWTALLKVMEELPSNVVLILISTTANRIPLSAISRCKKVHFYNVSDDEIVDRLQALAHQEDLEVEEGALSLIASRSNGSIHDAETILDQLSLVDKKVSLASVQKHVGLLPDRKLLNLLDFALSADTANTTKTMNEILGSSVEPLLLVSQLGILITNILVENFDVHRETRKSGYFRPSFSGKQMQRRLRQALKILSEAEKYVRVSTDSLTWLTAALLQCASDRPFPPSVVGSLAHTPMTPKSREQRLEMLVSTDVGPAENELHPTHASELAAEQTHEGHGGRTPKLSEPSSNIVEPFVEKSPVMCERELQEAWPPESKEAEEHKQVPERLNAQETPVAESIHVLEEQDSIELWNRVLQELTSRNLKHLLLTQGRLVSAGVASDGSRAIVEVEFQFAIDKHKAERSWRSICSAFQSVLNIPIELRISLMKNVFDDGLLPRNLEGMDDEELALVTQHMSRLKQEADVVSYSTDSHCGSHSKRRRRRARRDWQPTEMIEPEREAHSGSVPEPMQLTPRYKAMERTSARPNGEWHSNGMESSFSESVERHSGSLETVQSRLLVGVKARRPRLRTMLDTPLDESEDNQDTHSNSPEQMPSGFVTDRGLPLEAFCFPCTQRITQFRREPTRDVDQYDGRRDGDSGPIQMVGRGRAQGQAFFLRLLPCKSISTIKFSKASFSDIRCKS